MTDFEYNDTSDNTMFSFIDMANGLSVDLFHSRPYYHYDIKSGDHLDGKIVGRFYKIDKFWYIDFYTGGILYRYKNINDALTTLNGMEWTG